MIKVGTAVEKPFEPKRHAARAVTAEQELDEVMGWTSDQDAAPSQPKRQFGVASLILAVILTASVVANIAQLIAAMVR